MDAHRTLPVVQSSGTVDFMVAAYLARFPASTRSCYTSHLRGWLTWCLEHGLDPLAVQRAHIEAWGRHLTEERKLKVATVKAKLNCVCGMYKYAHLDGLIATNPAAHVRKPRVEFVSTTNALSRAQLARLIEAAKDDGPTSHALIALLAYNGLRIGECLAIDIDDFGYHGAYRTLHLPNRKGGKVSTVSLAIPTIEVINKAIDGRTSGPLLRGRSGDRLEVGAARRIVKKLCRQVGVTKRVTPHSLRHSFVTMALDAGIPERDIMASTGHATPVMVAYYDRNRGAIERNATHAVAAYIGA